MQSQCIPHALLVLTIGLVTYSSAQGHGPPGRATRVERLPLEVLPRHYELQLAPYFQEEKDFKALDVDGQVIIHVELRNTSTTKITLHAGDEVSIDNKDIKLFQNGPSGNLQLYGASSVTRNLENQMVTIAYEEQFYGRLTLQISFRSRLRTDMDGFYISQYKNNGQAKYLAATQFAPMSARKVFPCFDEPAIKANFSITVYPPAGYSALSNSIVGMHVYDATAITTHYPNEGVLPSAAHRDAITFKTTRPMSTYLVGMVIYDKETFTTTERPAMKPNGPLRIWSRNDLADQRDLALDVAAAALEFLGRLFPNYFRHMNDKLDQVAIPEFYFDAMENWGLITYREWGLLADKRKSSSSALRYAVTTIVHELSHQWFGDLVSPDFWNVVWLNEGFATYWAYHVNLGQLTDGWRLRDHFLVEQQALALDADALESTHALTSAPDTTPLFDDISYSKGGSVLRMFSYWLGEDKFYKELNTYLNNRKYTSAQPKDLFDPVREDGHHLKANYMETWTTTAGYPVINVTRRGRSATLTQARYLLTPSESASYSAPWSTLISYVSGTNFLEEVTGSVWLLGEKPAFIRDLEEGQPLFLNLNWTGFYRVNYDASSWQLILKQLLSNHTTLPRQTRAQLLSDVFSLARSDHVQYELAFKLSLYLVQEDNYLPWAIAFRAFEHLDAILISSDHYSAFQAYVKYLLQRLSQKLTFSVHSDDDHMTRSLRAEMAKWLCRMGDTSCRDNARQLAKNTPQTSIPSVDPDLRAAFYCVWAQDNVLWDKLWQHYLDTNVVTEKTEVLSALGCSQNETKLNMYLKYSLDSTKIKQQDVPTVFTGVCSTPLGVKLATKFISDNADAFAQNRFTEKIVTILAKRVLTEDELSEFQSLETLEALHKINPAIGSAVSTALAQAKWSQTHLNKLISWLEGGNIPVPSSGSLMVSHAMATIYASAYLVVTVGLY